MKIESLGTRFGGNRIEETVTGRASKRARERPPTIVGGDPREPKRDHEGLARPESAAKQAQSVGYHLKYKN